jgi:phosphopantothenoylcysteine decarboxylase/phosphopantothenate--cysteine ligase
MPIQPPVDTSAQPFVSVLITAGPTHEPIDAVRSIANRSSGRLGIALAQAARALGCRSTLLLGPVGIATEQLTNIQTGPANADPEQAPYSLDRVLRFRSSQDLEALLLQEAPACDVLVMAAAVADYRPREVHPGKLPRTGETLTITLEPVPDLLALATPKLRPGAVAIGFALEENAGDHGRALAKMTRKGCHAIVLNPLATMDSGDIDATILFADGSPPVALGPLKKIEFASRLIEIARGMWASARGTAS